MKLRRILFTASMQQLQQFLVVARHAAFAKVSRSETSAFT